MGQQKQHLVTPSAKKNSGINCRRAKVDNGKCIHKSTKGICNAPGQGNPCRC